MSKQNILQHPSLREGLVRLELDTFQIGLYIRGCLTSPSAESDVWSWCIDTLQRKLSHEQEDSLWAQVYQYCFNDYTHTEYREQMMQMLAAYNIRNRACIAVNHPDAKEKMAVYAYFFRGKWRPLNTMTEFIPDDWITHIRHEDRFDNHRNNHLGLIRPECYTDIEIYK